MKTYGSLLRSAAGVLGVVLLSLTALRSARGADGPSSEFSKPVIDVGMVVADPACMASFLTNAIGFKEVSGFAVTPELGRKIGLTSGKAGAARLFVLEGAEPATRIKVLAFPEAPPKPGDSKYIHSTAGFRYLTLFVADLDRAVMRLKKAGVALEGETPVELGGGSYLIVVRDPEGNFFELIGPRP